MYTTCGLRVIGNWLMVIGSLVVYSNCANGHAPVAGDVYIYGGPLVSRTITWSRESRRDSPFLGGGILVAEGDFDQDGGLEIGLLAVDKYYIRSRDDSALTQKIYRLDITTGYKRWLASFVGVGIGVYSAYSMGDPRTVGSEAGSNTTEYDTSATRTEEYGLDASLDAEIEFSDRVFGLVGARYQISETRKRHESADLFCATIAVKYFLPKPRIAHH